MLHCFRQAHVCDQFVSRRIGEGGCLNPADVHKQASALKTKDRSQSEDKVVEMINAHNNAATMQDLQTQRSILEAC